MQPRARFPFHPALQATVAAAGGVAVGALVGWGKADWRAAQLAQQVCGLGGAAVLALLTGLTAPLLVTTILLGNVGLEPMRRLGGIVRKTFGWMGVSSLLALAVGFGVARLFPWMDGGSSQPQVRDSDYDLKPWQEWSNWSYGWLALVLISLGFGYYRNQIDEGRGKLLVRFCQGVQEAATLLLRKTEVLLPLGIFFLAASETAQHGRVLGFSVLIICGRELQVLATAGTCYILAWLALAWLVARLPMWRLLPALWPAMIFGLTTRSPEATLPLTLSAVHREAGVSDRVAGVTLSLGATLQRDGVVLGWSVLACGWRHGSPSLTGDWSGWVFMALAACVVGGGLDALVGKAGLTPLFFLGMAGNTFGGGVLDAVFIAGVGGAVGVFSQACIAAIIARGEGEYWVPGPPPDPDELQGLKNDLATADS